MNQLPTYGVRHDRVRLRGRPLARGRRLTRACASLSVAGLALATFPPTGQAHGRVDTVVTRWNEAAGRAAQAACISPSDDPLHESRMYAMTHIAIHDALNAIDRRSTPYAAWFRAPREASVDAAVAAAAHDVLVPVIRQIPAPFPAACIDAGVASVETDYAAALRKIRDGRAKAAGLATGHRAATAVLALRAHDGSDTPLIVDTYPQGTAPGAWRFTPDRPFAFAPGWGGVTPFALASASQFKAAPPLALGSARYAADLVTVKALGGDGVTTSTRRTAAQTETALFWLESSPLSWNRIARTLANAAQLDPWEQARLFGLLNVSMADGYIGSFDTKYDYSFWRPVTAIRAAGTDGNPRTSPDPTWTPLRTTPPIPDHDSAHAVEGGAASTVFRRFFETDRFAFSACSLTLETGTCGDTNPTSHHFSRFSQAAHENAVSRVYIGFHFPYAAAQGLTHGERIGGWVAAHVMTELDD